MPGGPLGFFFMLTKVCVRDDPESERESGLLKVSALSFVLGIAASGLTAYLLTHLSA